MKIIITGAAGMLGTAIKNALTNATIYAFTSSELDITCTQQLDKTVANIKPDYIINCAAYTAVDLAETQTDKAYKINATAIKKLAQIAAYHKATLIHFSTDYVFNGTASKPYLSDDLTDPINAYGASKLSGELAIQSVNSSYYIFRLSWLYAPYGKNFFNWLATTSNDDLSIVTSQIGSPTSALQVAVFINYIIHNDPKEYGTYHYSNTGEMSWYDFAIAINAQLDLNKNIQPVTSYKTDAQRPAYSVMDSTRTLQVFNCKIKSVMDALDEVVVQFKS